MRRASWIVPTHERADILDHALIPMVYQVGVPDGWQVNCYVGVHKEDRESQRVIAQCGAQAVLVDTACVISKLNTALELAGELVLVSGDDDIQSPHRAREAILAYLRGYPMSGTSRFFFFNRDTGQMAQWEGPAHRAGAGMNYSKQCLQEAGGWVKVKGPGVDGALHDRLTAAGYPPDRVADLADAIGDTTTFTHSEGHGVSSGRPFPPKGERVHHGSFWITGV